MRWLWHAIAFVVLSPVLYVVVVMLFAIVLFQMLHISPPPAFFLVLVAPLEWMGNNVEWFSDFLGWVVKVCGL